jgi:hypothetical protein
MSQIKATNTKPELLVRKFLHARGYRYKLHDKTLPENPTSYYPDTKPSSLLTPACRITSRREAGRAVSGRGIKTINTLLFPNW